ncbi:MAG TPA: hypothetical protein VF412_19615 [Bdellovibrio sp.]|uniref:hypothetical protein n=1 Tax=Bdellovibrio sp. TaxID=28201 RepID=UPI002EF0728A
MKQVFQIIFEAAQTLMTARLGSFRCQHFHSLHPMGRGSVLVIEEYEYSAH